MNISEFIKLYDEYESINQFVFEMGENPTTELGSQLIERRADLIKEIATGVDTIVETIESIKSTNPRTIKIKYVRDIPHVKINTIGDWIDLFVADDIRLETGEYRAIPLGVAIQLPTGYEAIITPRSSTFNRYGIIMTNSVGVIDETYCGNNDEWHFPALCLKNGGTYIPKNTRIAQFKIVKHQPSIEFEIVNDLGNENRGGFGSTGI